MSSENLSSENTSTENTSSEPAPAGRLGRLAPGVRVTDLERSVAFYRDVLGMVKTFENGDPVGFVIVERDAAELHLTLMPGHRGDTVNVAHLMVEDAAGLYEHCTRLGVRIVKGLRDADYGLRTFVLADPDGNRLDIGQEL